MLKKTESSDDVINIPIFFKTPDSLKLLKFNKYDKKN